jgi:hypothetical protein
MISFIHNVLSLNRTENILPKFDTLLFGDGIVFLIDKGLCANSPCFNVYGDGVDTVETYDVFRCGQSVIWANETFFFIKCLDDLYSYLRSPQPYMRTNLEDVHFFDLDQYERAVGGGSCSELPDITFYLLCTLFLSVSVPHPDEVLYREQPSLGDQSGRGSSAVVWHWYNETVGDKLRTFTRCSEPPQKTTVRLGLDVPGYPEVCWEYAIISNRLFIHFVDNPRLDVWLTSDVNVHADVNV